ncbi:MAG: hypothetical protein AAGI38_09955 [Bacteroidota bacterium]
MLSSLKKLFAISCLCFSSIYAQNLPYFLSYDKTQSQFFGAENAISIHRMMYMRLDRVFPNKITDESKPIGHLTGIGYRLARLGLLDFQTEFMFTLVQHEAFGHGSRLREFGAEQVSVSLDLFFPFGRGEGSVGTAGGIIGPDGFSENVTVGFGGNEGSTILADDMEVRMLLGNSIHYRQSLFYLTSRNNLLFYTYRTFFRDASGDIRGYINSMNSLALGLGREQVYSPRRLFWQSLVAALNPMQIHAGLNIGNRFVIQGKSLSRGIPMLKLGNYQYMPSLGYNLTPFGSEYLMYNYVKRENKLYQLNLRLGDPALYNFWGIGIRAYNIIAHPWGKVNGTLEGWSQPGFIREGLVGVNNLSSVNRFGGLLKLRGMFYPFETDRIQTIPNSPRASFGLMGEVTYKTEGYLAGEPLGDGWVIRFGAALNL